MISIDYGTRVIYVPKVDTTLVQSTPFEIRQLDIDTFRLTLKDIEESEEGMPFPDTHRHFSPVSVGGVNLAMVVEIINRYTVTFEDGQYAVNLTGANSNIADRVNVNQVSVRSSNSAGLIKPETDDGGAVWAHADGVLVKALLRNKQVTDPATGKFTVYADDGSTPLVQGDLFEDAGGTQPYRGQGAERRERLA